MMNATRTTLSDALWRWQRGIARACRRPDDDAVIPGGKRGLSLVIAAFSLLLLATPAQAAPPAFQAISAIAASTGADVTVTLPAHETDDILLLLGWVRDQNDTVTVTGWTAMTGSPFNRSTVSRYWIFWKRAASASETNPLFNKNTTTGDTFVAVASYRGAISTGDPWEVKGAAATGTTDPASCTTINTVTANSLVVVPLGYEDDNNASIITTGTNPAAYVEHYLESLTGSDGMLSFSEAARTTAGATGAVSVNFDTAVTAGDGWGCMVLALKPRVFTKLQLLVPGETAAPGTPSGKTGTPTAQTTGTAFTVTVNAVDANWNLVDTVTDTVGITSSDASATLPGNAALVAGTRTFSVTLNTAGTATVTATDITDGTKTASTSPLITVDLPVPPAVQVDATSTGLTTSASLTISHTTSGTNRLMLVGVSIVKETGGAPSVSSITYNGVNLSLVGVKANSDNKGRTEIWQLVAPATGTHDVVVTLSAAPDAATAGVMTFTNVDQTTPLGPFASATADSTSGSATVSSEGGDLVFSTIVVEGTANKDLVPAGGQTERWDLYQAPATNGGGSTAPGASSVVMSWSFSADKWSVGGVSIKPIPAPGDFNAFETSTGTAATGAIKTKIAGVPVSFDMIALNTNRKTVNTAFTGTVRVEVLNASNNSGAFDGNGCRSSWTVIQTLSPDPAFVSGDLGRKTISFTQANSYPEVRLRITYPAVAPTKIGCSNDNFAIRPNTFANFAVTDTDWETAGTGRALNDVTFGTVIHKAGRPVSGRATALNAAGTPAVTTNYAGTPTATFTACAGAACTATFGTMGSLPFVAGQLVSDVASYDNVGSFALQLVDSTFANVDAGDGSTTSERNITSAVINVGRFVPDHFAVALNTPVFGTACGSFTYIGQSFNYVTAPVITVTAQGFANNTTTLYATSGSWWRITNASLTGKAYTAAVGTLNTSGITGTDPVIVSTGAGVGTLTFGSGTGLLFTRTTPVAPFNADISLAINVIDADGVTYASNPARFGTATAGNGIAFSSGKPMRFGRLQLTNALGSEVLNLPIPIQTQYWNGTSFVTNTLDSCTTITASNIALSNYQGNLNSGNLPSGNISISGAFNAGVGNLKLTKPSSAVNGSVDLCVDLDTGAGGDTACQATTPAGKTYLQGIWSGANYDRDPSARASFGFRKGFGNNSNQIIYQRENY